MTREELEIEVKELCPEMLSHEKFMHAAECIYCKEIPNDGDRLDVDEIESWHKLRDKLDSATVGQVIEYLKKNFKPDDKLCYMDCVEGMKNDCTYIAKDQLGDKFFKYVKTLKTSLIDDRGFTKDVVDNFCPYVDDNDVIVI